MNSITLLHEKVSYPAPLGGKVAGLMRLAHTFNVPSGFVLPADVPIIESDLLDAFDHLGVQKVAVRSSAVNEDGKSAAWAGQLETFLNVSRNTLVTSVKMCRESISSARAKAYSQHVGEKAGGVAVIVQTMLNSRLSGVAFSRHPVTREHTCVIEVVEGLGEALVSGTTTPDTYVVSEHKEIETNLSGSAPLMTESEIHEVADLTNNIEQVFNFPVDVEWAYEDDQLYVLQARPITAL